MLRLPPASIQCQRSVSLSGTVEYGFYRKAHGMNDSALTAALDAVHRAASNPSSFCWPFVELFPVSGAAVSTVGDLLGSETVSASDPIAARVDELQFDLGEGPCWDAMRLGRPILEPDLQTRPSTVWPAFSAAVLDQNVSSLFAFPLTVGALRIGAVDLYAVNHVDLNPVQTQQAQSMAGAVGKHVLRRALNAAGTPSGAPTLQTGTTPLGAQCTDFASTAAV